MADVNRFTSMIIADGAGTDFRWYRPAIRSVVAAAFRHGYWGANDEFVFRVKVMVNGLISPAGLPEKRARFWILGENEFCLGQSLLARKASDSQVSWRRSTNHHSRCSGPCYIMPTNFNG